jgi:hypothetical protein
MEGPNVTWISDAVIPAKAGIQYKHGVRSTQHKRLCVLRTAYSNWIPAFAGMTVVGIPAGEEHGVLYTSCKSRGFACGKTVCN